MLERWALDPSILYLNHGTVGAPPRRVLEAQQAIRDEIERQPAHFLLRELADIGDGIKRLARQRMRDAADRVAGFLGARGQDLVFTDNVTTALNAVLQSLPFEKGDEILMTDLRYGAIGHAAEHAAQRAGAVVRVAQIPYPFTPDGVIQAIVSEITPRTRLLVVDHISSESALLFPLAEIAALARERGVPVLVDGAHVPGAIELEIPRLGVDWYAGNLHKWAWSPRSAGLLWASPERQSLLHPAVISWGWGKGYTQQFDWVGTRDPSPWLAAPAAIDYLHELGWSEVREYNHRLAWDGARRLADVWGTRFETPESMIGTMATVPLPERFGSTPDEALRLRRALFEEDRIEVQIHAWRGRLWTRISAQIYVAMADMERFAEAVAARTAVTNEA
jgi:isopenicillin-N epimerase